MCSKKIVYFLVVVITIYRVLFRKSPFIQCLLTDYTLLVAAYLHFQGSLCKPANSKNCLFIIFSKSSLASVYFLWTLMSLLTFLWNVPFIFCESKSAYFLWICWPLLFSEIRLFSVSVSPLISMSVLNAYFSETAYFLWAWIRLFLRALTACFSPKCPFIFCEHESAYFTTATTYFSRNVRLFYELERSLTTYFHHRYKEISLLLSVILLMVIPSCCSGTDESRYNKIQLRAARGIYDYFDPNRKVKITMNGKQYSQTLFKNERKKVRRRRAKK